MYLLYVNTQEVYLLPKRALTAEQVSELRALLQTRKKAIKQKYGMLQNATSRIFYRFISHTGLRRYSCSRR